ncbi:Uncharacterised protein [Escherichia coli]|nr:hypothetical protein [Citrobacter freundii]QLO06886.1 hypothetical protein HV141_25800 [Citrobacter freundii]VVY58633.1 Uncharacterised protein [Escherichia coli]VVZ63196.1 Uncharacterised protein [Escherichia coli]VWN03016.1 Uncharacterised protein [Escherichia coli]
MHKIECPRCLGGKGEIRAFRHVQGGVCFRCKGRGYVEVKTIPKPSVRFVAMQKWANPEDVNYNKRQSTLAMHGCPAQWQERHPE